MRRRHKVGASVSAQATAPSKVIQVVVEKDRATRVSLQKAMTHRNGSEEPQR